jgi:membrane-bound ClpP family serine protease
MTRKFRLVFFLFLLLPGLSLSAFAFHPKVIPGINDGTGTGTVVDGNDVKLPIGLPFSINDPASLSGSSSDENGSYEKIIYTFDLPDGQGPQSFHETHSAFEQARSMNAACVLIRMNSMSGALNAAENLSNEISDYDRPVMVYVNDKAIPASTLISMAADNKKNAANAKQNKKAAAKNSIASKNTKTNSYQVGPVDQSFCRNGISTLPLGKQYSSGQNGDLDDVLTQAGLNNYTVVHYSPGFFAQVIDWCMKPYVSLLLVILIALGLRLQINSVFPGPATFLLLVSLPLFGVPLFVGGLAGAGEFGLVLFFAAAILMIAKKKVSSKTIRFIVALLFISALTLCQSENLSPVSSWQTPLLNFLLTSFTFIAGWYLPSFTGKFRRTSSARVSTAA